MLSPLAASLAAAACLLDGAVILAAAASEAEHELLLLLLHGPHRAQPLLAAQHELLSGLLELGRVMLGVG